MGITASQVKNLREKTGVGMMDCKKALAESDGNMEKAVEYLRTKGLAKAAKRADRASNAGVIAKFADGPSITLLQLNCETDFVAKNDDFMALAMSLARQVSSGQPADVEALSAAPYIDDTSKTVADTMAEAVAELGESLKIGRFVKMTPAADPGTLACYIHTGATIGVLVDFAVGKAETLEKDAFKTMAYEVAMHVAATAPAYLNPESIPQEFTDSEKKIYMAEARESGKPEKILEKIAEGKLDRFYKDSCLVNQIFVKDSELTIQQLLEQVSKESDDTITIGSFRRFTIGESD